MKLGKTHALRHGDRKVFWLGFFLRLRSFIINIAIVCMSCSLA
jgi:hypothetical protein